ncbi:MAG TPA: hypothetical protein VIG55_02695 [Methylosinus sp.]|jgi:hypothetical protein
MWRRFEPSSKQWDGLAELGFVELVDMLLRPVLPVAFMGVAVTSVRVVVVVFSEEAEPRFSLTSP